MKETAQVINKQITIIEKKISELIGEDNYKDFKKGWSALVRLGIVIDADIIDLDAPLSTAIKDDHHLLLPEIQSLTVREFKDNAKHYRTLQDNANQELLGVHREEFFSLWWEFLAMKRRLLFIKLSDKGKERGSIQL